MECDQDNMNNKQGNKVEVKVVFKSARRHLTSSSCDRRIRTISAERDADESVFSVPYITNEQFTIL